MRSALPAILVLVGACSNGPTTGEHGTMQVSVSTTGAGARPGSYQVRVDARQGVSTIPNGTAAIFDLSAGVHTVQMTAIPLNCTPDWYAPQQVTVVASAAATVVFHVSCDVPLTGSIVFTKRIGPSGALFAMRDDGSDLRQLTTPTTYDDHAAVSPGGTRIAFLRGAGELWVMNADGSSPTRISTSRSDVASPDWSPDGTQLVFTSARSIVTVTADGRSERVVWAMAATDGSIVVAEPRWSPDGTRLVYSYGKELDLINVRTGAITNMRPPNNVSWGTHPVWSPNGDRIAYLAGTNLSMINSDGTGDMVVRDMGFGDVAGIAWAGGGGRLVVSISPTTGGIHDVFTMAADGSGLVNLTNTPEIQEFFPTWTPP